MTATELRGFITRFRQWLSAHGELALTPEDSAYGAEWRDELDAAERMLEARPELPIAFLGPSQQGKSSLINALLGENILAVGGAVGACTCVITSAHYRRGAGFRAEIDFLPMADWRSELQAMQDAIMASGSVDDTLEDRQERDAAAGAALEKFKAVYRLELADTLAAVIADPRLGLSDEIVRAMSSGRPIVIEVDNALTLRNRVRRYLVGREQHEDGQFWPLISRVRVFGDFRVLSNGVVLVDLPGLNDPNPAREQVTRKYLEDARYIWLVCNSQTGIDRVFTDVLRNNGFFFRLFLEGRLDAFSVIATRIDDINIEAVLGQLGVEVDAFDQDYRVPLEFKRKQIADHVQRNLLSIAEEVVARADVTAQSEAFLNRVRAIQVFSVSTAAYLHSQGRMPLYQGMKLAPEETHVPRLIEHLHSITRESGHAAQIEAATLRLQGLRERVRRFFLDLTQRADQQSADAKREWQSFGVVASSTIDEGERGLRALRMRSEQALEQACTAFDERLRGLDARAIDALQTTVRTWEGIHWRSLLAAATRDGEWLSRATGRDINFNRDVAHTYLDLIPFIWDDFFGAHLARIVNDATEGAEAELRRVAATLKGALDMLHQQQDGIRPSLETSLRSANQSFGLKSGLVRAELTAQVQRTRQGLSGGVVATAKSVMASAYVVVRSDPGGSGIKRRVLSVLCSHAELKAPGLYVGIRQDLAEGVTVLRAALKPQLDQIVVQGEKVLSQFRYNIRAYEVVTPALRERARIALEQFPSIPSEATTA